MESPPKTCGEFASFIKEHSRIINKVCWVYANPKVPYEDLRQEILTNLWLCLNQFRGTSKLSTRVYRVAVNLFFVQSGISIILPPPNSFLVLCFSEGVTKSRDFLNVGHVFGVCHFVIILLITHAGDMSLHYHRFCNIPGCEIGLCGGMFQEGVEV